MTGNDTPRDETSFRNVMYFFGVVFAMVFVATIAYVWLGGKGATRGRNFDGEGKLFPAATAPGAGQPAAFPAPGFAPQGTNPFPYAAPPATPYNPYGTSSPNAAVAGNNYISGGQYVCPGCGRTGLPNFTNQGTPQCPSCGGLMTVNRGGTAPGYGYPGGAPAAFPACPLGTCPLGTLCPHVGGGTPGR